VRQRRSGRWRRKRAGGARTDRQPPGRGGIVVPGGRGGLGGADLRRGRGTRRACAGGTGGGGWRRPPARVGARARLQRVGAHVRNWMAVGGGNWWLGGKQKKRRSGGGVFHPKPSLRRGSRRRPKKWRRRRRNAKARRLRCVVRARRGDQARLHGCHRPRSPPAVACCVGAATCGQRRRDGWCGSAGWKTRGGEPRRSARRGRRRAVRANGHVAADAAARTRQASGARCDRGAARRAISSERWRLLAARRRLRERHRLGWLRPTAGAHARRPPGWQSRRRRGGRQERR